jgi:amyloid beta precursor protein binding protein 1
MLQELNESVLGSYIEESPETLISNNPSFFSQFTVIVATQVRTGILPRFFNNCTVE